MLRLLSALLAVLVLATACNSGGDDSVDLPQTLTTSSQNARMSFPEGWVGRGAGNALTFANTDEALNTLPENLGAGQVRVTVSVVQNIVSGFGLQPDASLEEVFTTQLAADSPSVGEIERFNEDENPALFTSGTIALPTGTFGVIYAMINEDSAYAFLSIVAPEDEIDNYVDTARSMIVTFDAEPPPVDQ